MAGIKGKIDKNFSRDKEGLTSSALGALAGGLIGHEAGKGLPSAAVGALIGGLGANAWETRESKYVLPKYPCRLSSAQESSRISKNIG